MEKFHIKYCSYFAVRNVFDAHTYEVPVTFTPPYSLWPLKFFIYPSGAAA